MWNPSVDVDCATLVGMVGGLMREWGCARGMRQDIAFFIVSSSLGE